MSCVFYKSTQYHGKRWEIVQNVEKWCWECLFDVMRVLQKYAVPREMMENRSKRREMVSEVSDQCAACFTKVRSTMGKDGKSFKMSRNGVRGLRSMCGVFYKSTQYHGKRWEIVQNVEKWCQKSPINVRRDLPWLIDYG